MVNRLECLAVAAGAALALACSIGCTNGAKPNAQPAAPAVAPPIDRVDIFVRTAAREAVEVNLRRQTRGNTVTWYVRRYDHERRPMGPVEEATDMAVRMLDTFDLWALNAPDAPGAACRTILGQRSCSITFNDYSLVMQVQRGREVRVQRYTGLDKRTAHRSARELGDFIFAWARMREERVQHP